ncbi:unnamed protein product [Rotaria sp. Silwood2]|nr:unnamed protein product [Rotaria sp. Silwood2]CAF3035594.1 unnamed protein product [Rotaria sp. Silwood2]CAF3414787.1 unnamed protein product [Rotaria sp. Silwood2]CAF3968683.1 unnamed protein product [Rotaria sp. Silwood2]CAF4310025.1 unnamed protein product [Rotaria sp. Silwood2]
MTTNAAYCKTYRKRIFNFEGRVQQTATPIPPPQHNFNVNADADMMNNEVNDFFEKMNDINGNQTEQNLFINSDDSIDSGDGSSDPDSDSRCSCDDDYEDSNTCFYSNGSITLRQTYTAIKAFIIKCSLSYTHILHLISLLFYL